MLSPYPVFPVSAGGKIRIVQLARNLSEVGVEVTVLTPYHFTQLPSLYEGENFKLRQFKYPFIYPFLFTNRPFPYEYCTSIHPGMAALIKKFLNQYDIFQFEHSQFASLIDHIQQDKVVVYDAHNVEYDYVRSECKTPKVEKIAGQRTFHLEEKLCRRAGHIFACSQLDKSRLVELYKISPDSISVAPNGVRPVAVTDSEKAGKVAIEKFPRLAEFPQWAIYSGSDVEHNRVAVRFILEKLAPALKDRCAFIIHGTCVKAFQRTEGENVFLDGASDGLNHYVAPQTVGLNPVMQGSGTNLKLTHYLSHGLPVISTPFGMRGYDDLQPFVTVAEPENFVEALKGNGRAATIDPQELQKRYGWREIATEMKEVYSRLTR